MFLHVGGDIVLPLKEIVAILDLETTSVSKDTKNFLNDAQKAGIIETISEDLPKSYIIVEKNGKKKVYLSHISSATLQKRAGHIGDTIKI